MIDFGWSPIQSKILEYLALKWKHQVPTWMSGWSSGPALTVVSVTSPHGMQSWHIFRRTVSFCLLLTVHSQLASGQTGSGTGPSCGEPLCQCPRKQRWAGAGGRCSRPGHRPTPNCCASWRVEIDPAHVVLFLKGVSGLFSGLVTSGWV